MLTPIDLDERYGLTNGHIHHGELALDQLFTMRPILGHAQYRTPIDGLFLCGAGTHPGGGVSGLSGRNAAREILRSLSDSRWPAMRRLTALGAAVLLTAGCSSPDRVVPLGFTRGSADAQRSLEQRLIERADAARVREVHRELTRLPHPAGSSRDRELAGWIAEQFSDAGLEDVRISTHEVLLPRPLEVSVGASAPVVWRAQMPEGMDGAPGPSSPSLQELLPDHAFSASGEVNAPVVYAGPGAPADYEWLATHGVDVNGRIVLVHSAGPYRYRGLAAFTAQQFGAAAVLMFRLRDQDDRSGVPGMDAVAMRAIERGSILYDFFYPGDPETPGWPSVPGARRLARDRLPTLPRIISVPIAATTAELIRRPSAALRLPCIGDMRHCARTSARVPHRFGSRSAMMMLSGRSGR